MQNIKLITQLDLNGYTLYPVGLYLLTIFLKPKYAPMKVSGTEIQNQSANIATRVPNGMAAEEPSPQRIRFITKKSAKTTLSGDR